MGSARCPGQYRPTEEFITSNKQKSPAQMCTNQSTHPAGIEKALNHIRSCLQLTQANKSYLASPEAGTQHAWTWPRRAGAGTDARTWSYFGCRVPGHTRTAHGCGHGVREQVQLPADGQVVALRRAERHRCYVRRAPHARARKARANLL